VIPSQPPRLHSFNTSHTLHSSPSLNFQHSTVWAQALSGRLSQFGSWRVMDPADDITTTITERSSAPKRVAGGVFLPISKGKKRKRQQSTPPAAATSSSTKSSSGGVEINVTANNQLSSSATVDTSSSTIQRANHSTIPSILTSIPSKDSAVSSKNPYHAHNSTRGDEFEIDADEHDADVPCDTLMCLQSYTRSPNGRSETCAYCPIYTASKETDTTNAVPTTSINGTRRTISSTHAAPFLPRNVLFYILDTPKTTTNNTSSSSRSRTNEEIKQLAMENKVRLLQLHGTAVSRNGLGWRGDGNDDEDIAVMEWCSYEETVRMALRCYFSLETRQVEEERADAIYSWYTALLLTYFAGRTWFSLSSLKEFVDSTQKTNRSNSKRNFPLDEVHGMIKELVHAGLLLPRRRFGLNGGEGYWFSLPGLGNAAKSLVDGRLAILRRIQSSKFNEKKRSVLEQGYGGKKISRSAEETKGDIQQYGKFLVLDLLSKDWVTIHETCNGVQYVRLVDA
jgi:hypothetical protein